MLRIKNTIKFPVFNLYQNYRIKVQPSPPRINIFLSLPTKSSSFANTFFFPMILLTGKHHLSPRYRFTAIF